MPCNWRAKFVACPWIRCRWHMIWIFLPDSKWADSQAQSVRKMEDDEIVRLMENMAFSCEIDLLRAYPDGVTLSVLGEIMGCTRERVRQIQETAHAKLQKRMLWSKYQAYKDYWDHIVGLSSDPYESLYPDIEHGLSDPMHSRRWHRQKRQASNNRWEKYHEVQKRR